MNGVMLVSFMYLCVLTLLSVNGNQFIMIFSMALLFSVKYESPNSERKYKHSTSLHLQYYSDSVTVWWVLCFDFEGHVSDLFVPFCLSGVEQGGAVDKPSTCVTRVRFLYSTSHVGWVCCWFSPCFKGFWILVLWLPPSTKTDTCKFHLDDEHLKHKPLALETGRALSTALNIR